MHRNQRRRKGRAFSLMEVLAAMVLMAIVLPSVMRGVTLCLQSAGLARHKIEAAALAESQLNLMLALRDPTYQTGTGTFGDEWRAYRWEATATRLDLDLYEVTVTVFWTERGFERSQSLSTFILPTTTTTATASS